MAGKAILNYTTSIDAAKTAMECISILLGHGATNVAISAGEDKAPDGLEFVIATPWGPRQFVLPVNIEGTEKSLRQAWREHRIEPRFATREQARRVAWRIVKDWLESQLALIEAMQVDLLQVMLPYLKVAPGKTLYAAYVENELRELEAGR